MKIGDTLPNFSIKNQNGTLFESTQLIKNNPFVIYFYPKNFTPGCNKEACSFRDSFEDFTALGATVVGISADSVASHKNFKNHYQLPFTLLSDPKNKVRKQFGVKGELLGILPGRETFVFNKEGKLTFKFRSMGAEGHIRQALKHLQS